MNGRKLNVLVIGARGLIGSAISARLKHEGHLVTGLARTGRRGGAVEITPFDIARATKADGCSLGEAWISASIALYILAGLFWLPVVWMQMEIRRLAEAAVHSNTPLPPRYHKLFWRWFAFGFPAFDAVMALVWLMIARPDLGRWF